MLTTHQSCSGVSPAQCECRCCAQRFSDCPMNTNSDFTTTSGFSMSVDCNHGGSLTLWKDTTHQYQVKTPQTLSHIWLPVTRLDAPCTNILSELNLQHKFFQTSGIQFPSTCFFLCHPFLPLLKPLWVGSRVSAPSCSVRSEVVRAGRWGGLGQELQEKQTVLWEVIVWACTQRREDEGLTWGTASCSVWNYSKSFICINSIFWRYGAWYEKPDLSWMRP